jgi:hypothetical protein
VATASKVSDPAGVDPKHSVLRGALSTTPR